MLTASSNDRFRWHPEARLFGPDGAEQGRIDRMQDDLRDLGREHDADQPAPPRRQLLRLQIGREADLAEHRLEAQAGLRADAGLAVDDARDGRDRDAGEFRHVVDRQLAIVCIRLGHPSLQRLRSFT